MMKRILHTIRKFFGLENISSSEEEEFLNSKKSVLYQKFPQHSLFSSSGDSMKKEPAKYRKSRDYDSIPHVSPDVLAYTHIDDELLRDLGYTKPENQGRKGRESH